MSGNPCTDDKVKNPQSIGQPRRHATTLARNEGQNDNLKESRQPKGEHERKPKNIDEQKQGRPKNPRPTHFLALPLHTFPELRQRVLAFQNALFNDTDRLPTMGAVDSTSGHFPNARIRKPVRMSSLVQGLDSSIVIDPRRLHMTLGVMSLEPDSDGPQDKSNVAPLEGAVIASTTSKGRVKERRTPSTVLELLRSLQPQIKQILQGDAWVRVPLDVMDVLKTERMRPPRPSQTSADLVTLDVSAHVDEARSGTSGIRQQAVKKVKGGESVRNESSKVGAGVLFLGPAPISPKISDEQRRLMEVCDLVHRTFKQAGYITEQRPLKLHCTILNASHRKPMRRMPFCYSDILAVEESCKSITSTNNTLDGHGGPLETKQDAVLDSQGPQTSFTSRTQGAAEAMNAMTIARPPAADHRPQYPSMVVPPPLNVNLGSYNVQSIEIWVMGSRNENNEYVSLGGLSLC